MGIVKRNVRQYMTNVLSNTKRTNILLHTPIGGKHKALMWWRYNIWHLFADIA